jgi:coenzyme F420 biosynthesis associated uncharacterized protein
MAVDKSNKFSEDEDSGKSSTIRYGKIATGLGLATAAAFGAVWANSRARDVERNGPPSMIDWNKVRDIAERMNPETGATAEWRNKWTTYYSELTLKVVPIIEEYANTKLPRQLNTVRAVSRNEWVEANINSFRQLFEPIERLNRDSMGGSSAAMQAMVGGFNQLLVSGEMGILLGYLSRRVLGQYDLSLLGREPVADGRVFFVEPNIGGVVNALNLNGDEFRLWIALHESTHAFEFESHTWVRRHFNGILERYFSYLTEDLQNMRLNKQRLNNFMRRIRDNTQGSSWIERVMTPEQRTLFSELQALMSIVEGYSNHVMNAVGEKLMPNYNTIKERIERRQKDRGIIDKLFIKLTGLDLKMEQYRLGEIFVDRVVELKGIDFANLMWDRPEYIPTLDEIKKPELWVNRIEKAQAA